MLKSGSLISLLLLVSLVCAQTPSPAVPPDARPPIIILIGPPLSGKTVFVQSITRDYGIPSISIEDLIRSNAAELDKLRGQGISLAEMRYDPSISRYLRERLKTADLVVMVSCVGRLPGYPCPGRRSCEPAA